jgi:alpha/beta superfamily hydrolase
MTSLEKYIRNRNNKKISLIVEKPKKIKGLAIFIHGLGGFKEHKLLETISRSFFSKEYATVRFDCRNSIGKSQGKYEFASVTSYYQDLEDVIAWVKKQSWYCEPFFLIGHSIGGMCVIRYAEKHPIRVKGIVGLAPVINGKDRVSNIDKKDLLVWKKTGYLIRPSLSKPGTIFRLRYDPYIPDMLKWDTVKESDAITMPIIIILGSNDVAVKKSDVEKLYKKLTCKKEMHNINNADHFFRIETNIKTANMLISKWIKKVENHGKYV